MKRNIISFCAIALVGLSLGALGLSNRSSNTKQADEVTTKVKKHKVKKQYSKKDVNKDKSNISDKETAEEQSREDTSTNSQQNTQSSTNTTQTQKQNVQVQPQQSQQQKTQGQINKEHGYDPKGNPLLPGQDHAAGSNPDGSPDSWVQGQIDWAKKNGYMNQDGSPTEKGQQAINEVYANADPSIDGN